MNLKVFTAYLFGILPAHHDFDFHIFSPEKIYGTIVIKKNCNKVENKVSHVVWLRRKSGRSQISESNSIKKRIGEIWDCRLCVCSISRAFVDYLESSLKLTKKTDSVPAFFAGIRWSAPARLTEPRLDQISKRLV